MPTFDSMYYDQKWSVWDTWKAAGRNVRAYVITAGTKVSRVITGQNRRTNVITGQNRRTNITTAGG